MHKLILFTQRVLLVIAIIFSVIIQNALGQTSEPSDSLKKVLINKEAEMFNITSTGDKAAFDKIVGEDYMTINADGVMENKTDMMKTFGKFKGSTSALSEKRIRTYGNLAIITGRAKFYVKSILAADVFYTETWLYRNGNWEFIGWHGTMTGLPSYYSIIVTVIVLVLLYFIVRIIRRRMRKPAKVLA